MAISLQSVIGFPGVCTYAWPMRLHLIIPILIVILLVPAFSRAEGEGGCAPEFRALFDDAVVELKGAGELDVVVLTDPFCWHCRLGHKLLGEYPELYRSLKLSFFSRKSVIGSDMAAWILEDVAGTDRLETLVNFAYTNLKHPRIKDLVDARRAVLVQFVAAFPDMLDGTNLDELHTRLEKDHSRHVLKSAELARAAKMPGTPVLIAGQNVVVGYGPDAWLKALEKNAICE